MHNEANGLLRFFSNQPALLPKKHRFEISILIGKMNCTTVSNLKSK